VFNLLGSAVKVQMRPDSDIALQSASGIKLDSFNCNRMVRTTCTSIRKRNLS